MVDQTCTGPTRPGPARLTARPSPDRSAASRSTASSPGSTTPNAYASWSTSSVSSPSSRPRATAAGPTTDPRHRTYWRGLLASLHPFHLRWWSELHRSSGASPGVSSGLGRAGCGCIGKPFWGGTRGAGVARKAARARAWHLGGAPPVVAAALAGQRPDEPLCIDLDATLITAHCDDKDGAAVTYKKGWGFHPLLAYLDRGDGLGESLGGQLRPGNAGSNTAADHSDVFEAALDQLGELPDEVRVVVRADTAGCTHGFLAYLRTAGVGFSVGYAITEAVRTAIRALDEADAEADPGGAQVG